MSLRCRPATNFLQDGRRLIGADDHVVGQAQTRQGGGARHVEEETGPGGPHDLPVTADGGSPDGGARTLGRRVGRTLDLRVGDQPMDSAGGVELVDDGSSRS